MKSTSLLVLTCALLTALPGSAAVTVYTVPWDPTNLVSPHTVITSVQATLTGTVNLGGATDSFTYQWNFGDSNSSSSKPVTQIPATHSNTVGNTLNLSATHIYTAAAGTSYTAVLTVTDTTTSTSSSQNYYVIVQNNTLSARVNMAIDNGLWALHTSMDRTTKPNASSVQIPVGGWDGQEGSGCLSPGNTICLNSVGLDATNVQAFEVSGHFDWEANASVDPYADDVGRGLALLETFLDPEQNSYEYYYYPYGGPSGPKTIDYNPALTATRCSDGSLPANYGTATQSCTLPATLINYNPGATTCTTAPTTPCSFTYDGNSNHQMLLIPYAADGSGDYGYQIGMIATAFVASQHPTGVAALGAVSAKCVGGDGATVCPGVQGQTLLTIVQDINDGIGFCQYYGDAGSSTGDNNGGAWEYYCSGTSSEYVNYDDNSPSQWNAIALIAGSRAFGVSIPQIVKDTNQVWMTWDEDVTTASKGEFGYAGWNSYPWGPWAVSPSGMVQLAMDGIGRNPLSTGDQRWNLAESYYRNNFCNATSSGATAAPRAYFYGMFSFTKSMEQHDPGGALSPITLLADQPSGANPIDWYNALSPANGGTAACDGVAQTLVATQNYSGYPGVWFGNDYDGTQYYFDTAWAIIMLQKTSFVACVNNLGGVGKASSRSSGAESTLTWSAIGDATAYQLQRGTTNGGPYSNVGSPTTGLAQVDQTAGLVNGSTYYYVLQPLSGTPGNYTAVCQSNQVAITIP